MLLSAEEADVHEAFEQEFCNLIKDSKLQAFQEITSCSIDFTYDNYLKETENDPVTWPWHHHHDRKDTFGHVSGQVQLNHVMGSDSGSSINTDVAVMGKALIDSYNQVHADTPFYLTSFSLEVSKFARSKSH